MTGRKVQTARLKDNRHDNRDTITLRSRRGTRSSAGSFGEVVETIGEF